MWDNQYEPPESIFDGLEPAIFLVFIVAMFAIIPFTPLSPFEGREASALDQLAGVNTRETEIRNAVVPAATRFTAKRLQQVEVLVETAPVTR